VQPVAVRILHPPAGATTGPLERALTDARTANAERLSALFRAAGADDVRIESGDRRTASFGEHVRGLVNGIADRAGLVLLGSGSIPLATTRDAATFVEIARSGARRALANNFYSADVVALGEAAALGAVPDLASDNALPRWLADEAGFEVHDLRRRWRLGNDLDSPLDVLLVGGTMAGVDTGAVDERLARIRSVAVDPRAQLVVAGRTGASMLRWLERRTASRTRALVEERGLRASGLSPLGSAGPAGRQRPPRSVLGLVLDDRGPEVLGEVLGELGDAAIVDTRVLLAHRLGADESGWPPPEDRFASDLLLPDQVRDSWLQALTAAARDAAIPVLLGGHTLVGPGLRLALGRQR
jgi:GNAT superfamily N-acetyltransferase